MSTIAENLHRVRECVAEAARRAGRDPHAITIVAVSKTQPAIAIEEAYAAGQRDFGENYVQEAREKFATLGYPDIRWHLIGHIQTNKAKHVAPIAHLVQSVDSARLAGELAHRATQLGRRLPVLLQVNVGGEEQKSGVEPEEAPELARHIAGLDSLDLRGLMTMPPFLAPEEVRPMFRRLRMLRDELRGSGPGLPLDDLSMGMSGDFEVAVEEGATIVRVGTAIFGERG